ncbi:hypothetical protein [Calothrix rhizosoleniae]|uniref:hypothetical protein n=1 Tax=Calothrix rhizosoleniae TaxID=888997 RepID=UPI000B4A32FC|nr:hypothetical protein [Calothrix rhizosoleniae]
MKKSPLAMLPKSPLGLLMAVIIALSYGFSSGLIDYQSRSDQLAATAQSQSRKYTLFQMAVIIAISYGFSSGLIDYQSRSDQLATTAQSQSRKYTLLHYEKLSEGISLLEAQIFVNGGIEIKSSATTVVIRWTNSDGSTITATFTKNKLTDKEHTL